VIENVWALAHGINGSGSAGTEIPIAVSAGRRHSRFDDAERIVPMACAYLLGADTGL